MAVVARVAPAVNYKAGDKFIVKYLDEAQWRELYYLLPRTPDRTGVSGQISVQHTDGSYTLANHSLCAEHIALDPNSLDYPAAVGVDDVSAFAELPSDELLSNVIRGASVSALSPQVSSPCDCMSDARHERHRTGPGLAQNGDSTDSASSDEGEESGEGCGDSEDDDDEDMTVTVIEAGDVLCYCCGLRAYGQCLSCDNHVCRYSEVLPCTVFGTCHVCRHRTACQSAALQGAALRARHAAYRAATAALVAASVAAEHGSDHDSSTGSSSAESEGPPAVVDPYGGGQGDGAEVGLPGLGKDGKPKGGGKGK